MCFNKQSVYTNRNTGFGNGFNKLRHTTCHSTCLIGLLQRMCNIQNDRITEGLHFRNATVVYNKVLISESCSTFGNHNFLISGFYYLFRSKAHGEWRQELSFFDVNHLSCFCSSYQNVCLAAKECWYLQYIYIFGGHCGFFCRMYICNSRHTKSIVYFL